MQAVGNDVDNSTDLLGNLLPFFYSWTALGPGGLPLGPDLTAALYTDAALQEGLVSFPSNTLAVSPLSSAIQSKGSQTGRAVSA